MPLQRLLEEPQCGRFVPRLDDLALQDLAVLIDRAPQITRLAVD